jgi:hypothetical protein
LGVWGGHSDICHFAGELQQPQAAIGALRPAGINISKIHLPAPLKTKTAMESRATLKHFADDIHRLQVVTGGQNIKLQFFATCPRARRQSAIGIMADSLPHFSACARRAAVQEPP